MKFLLTIAFLMIATFGSAQKNNYAPFQKKFQETPLNELPLFGKVSAIKIEQLIYEYNNDNKKISKTRYVSGTQAGFKKYFDLNRNIIRQVTYDTDGTIISDISYYNHDEFILKDGTWFKFGGKYTSEIDSLNRVINGKKMNQKGEIEEEEIIKYKEGFIPVEKKVFEKGILKIIYKWEYDNNNNLVSYAFKGLTTSFAEKTIYKDGKISEILAFNNISSIDSIQNADFFSQKQITYEENLVKMKVRDFTISSNSKKLGTDKVVIYSPQNKILGTKNINYSTKRKYNNFHQETEYIEYDKVGKIVSVNKKQYNDKRDMVEEINESIPRVKVTMKYKYDYLGNWIESLEYRNDLLISKTTRQIEYY